MEPRRGGLGGFAPAYEGSDKYRLIAYPVIIPRYYSDSYNPLEAPRVKVVGIDDIRFTALRYGQFDLGVVLGYKFGRDEDDADLLEGIGNIKGGLNVGGFGSINFSPFYIDAAFIKQVTGDSDLGHTIRFGVGWEDKLADRLTTSAYISTSYASQDYMDAHFSITPAQSASSVASLSVYEAGAGFKNLSLKLGADYDLTNRWSLKSRLGYSYLIGDAAHSPVTASRNQFTGGIGLIYTFGRTR